MVSIHNARTRTHNGEIKLSTGHNTVFTLLDVNNVPTALRKVTMLTVPYTFQPTNMP